MAIKKIKKPVFTFLVFTLLLAVLFSMLRPAGLSSTINQSAKYPLSDLQRNVIESIIQDDVVSLLTKKESTYTYEELGIDQIIEAKKLFLAYEANEVAADNLYRGKTLIVDGKIADISKDAFDNPILTLTTKNMFMNVQANMIDDEIPNLSSLSKGDSISLVCRGDGVIIGSPIIKKCQNSESYLKAKAFEKVNSFLEGKNKNDKNNLVLVSYAAYFGSKLPQDSACHTVASTTCLEDLEKVAEKAEPVSPHNSDYMVVVEELHNAGVISDEILRKLIENLGNKKL